MKLANLKAIVAKLDELKVPDTVDVVVLMVGGGECQLKNNAFKVVGENDDWDLDAGDHFAATVTEAGKVLLKQD